MSRNLLASSSVKDSKCAIAASPSFVAAIVFHPAMWTAARVAPAHGMHTCTRAHGALKQSRARSSLSAVSTLSDGTRRHLFGFGKSKKTSVAGSHPVSEQSVFVHEDDETGGVLGGKDGGVRFERLSFARRALENFKFGVAKLMPRIAFLTVAGALFAAYTYIKDDTEMSVQRCNACATRTRLST